MYIGTNGWRKPKRSNVMFAQPSLCAVSSWFMMIKLAMANHTLQVVQKIMPNISQKYKIIYVYSPFSNYPFPLTAAHLCQK